MHDANDLESLEDFYSGDSDDAANGDYDFIDNYSEDDFDDFAVRRNQVILAILLKFRFSYSSAPPEGRGGGGNRSSILAESSPYGINGSHRDAADIMY